MNQLFHFIPNNSRPSTTAIIQSHSTGDVIPTVIITVGAIRLYFLDSVGQPEQLKLRPGSSGEYTSIWVVTVPSDAGTAFIEVTKLIFG